MSCKRLKRAFSLVEIMIVVVIIGLLAGVVTLNVRTYMDKAKQNTARREIATVAAALETFYSEYGRYPANEEGLDLLIKPSERFAQPLLNGGLADPWGKTYQYIQPGRESHSYEVVSFGADGKPGGTGVDADIISWQLKENPKP